jgi:hypothetical protein
MRKEAIILFAYSDPNDTLEHFYSFKNLANDDNKQDFTTGFGVFAERRDPLGEGPFPLGEGFTERKLSANTSH